MSRCLTLLLVCLVTSVWAADPTPHEAYTQARKLLETGESKGEAATLRKARKLFLVAAGDEGLAVLAHYHAGYACLKEVHLIRSVTGRKSVLDRAITELQTVQKLDEKMAEVPALLASCYGQKINLDSSQAMTLGPQIGQLMGKASRLEPQNPRVTLLAAVNQYYTPPAFGGSKEKAFEKLQLAAKQFESWKAPSKNHPSWGKAEVHAWIGLVHLERGELPAARKALDKALAVDPDYAFVTGSLKPRLEQAEKKAG